VEALIDQLEAFQSNEAIGRFAAVKSRKVAMRDTLSALEDVETTARRLWITVANQVSSCSEEGVDADSVNSETLVSYEDLSEALQQASDTNLCDEQTDKAARELLRRSEDEAAVVKGQLDVIEDASDESVQAAEQLIRRIRAVPIKAADLKRVLYRRDVCKAVHKALGYLSRKAELLLPSEEADGAIGTSTYGTSTTVMSDGEMAGLKELRSSIEKYRVANDEIEEGMEEREREKTMVQLVHAPFLLLCWHMEMRSLWKTTSPLGVADRLLQAGKALGEEATASPEYERLAVQFQVGKDHAKRVEEFIQKIGELKAKCNELKGPDKRNNRNNDGD
jgi:hypothetical protein